MECQYYNPKLKILLCRHRLTSDWQATKSFKEPFWRFYWHSKVPAKLYFNEQSYELGNNVFTLIAPDTDFHVDSREAYKEFYIHFQAAYPFNSCTPGIYVFNITDSMRGSIETACKMLEAEETKPSRKLSMLIMNICGEALLNVPENCFKEDFGSRKVTKVIEYIETHFAENLTNNILAEKSGIDKNVFIRYFKKHTGKTPQKMLQERRIREACILLRFTRNTIDEIAQQTGFTDRYYFSRVFKKQRGISPAAFRKNSM